jgi:RHS repeat-associated protein
MRSRLVVSLLVQAAAIFFGCRPAAAQHLFNQTDASATSIGSWYSDNWYQLGTGFSGTLNTLTLQCYTSGGPLPSSSNLYLQEFSDSGYTVQTNNYQLNINGNPTCDQYPNYRTFNNLNIPILPTLYYRLYTYANIQNASAILLGTSSTGLAMYDSFDYGVGKVYFYYTFYPYVLSTTPPLPPPPPACPTPASSVPSFPARQIFGSTIAISAIGLWIYPAGGAYATSESYLTLLSDSMGDPGQAFATSNTVTIGQYDPPTEHFYPFSPPVTIPGGTAFWVQLNGGPSPTSGTGVESMIDYQGTCTAASAANFGSPSTANQTAFAFEPINTATGNYYASHADVVVPGQGVAFNFTRSYNSLDSYAGPLGAGWTHSFNAFLTLNPDGTVSIKEADGHQVTFSPTGGGAYIPATAGVFDALNQNADGSFTVVRKSQTRFNFSSVGKLTSIVDRNGNAQTLSYNGAGALASILDSSGRTFAFASDTSGRITGITDPMGRSWQYSYDANNNLISVQDAAGNLTQYAYDANHRMVSATDPRGVTYLKNTYDTQGRVVTQTNARGFATTLSYGTPAAGTTTFTDPLGNATQHVYDGTLRLIQVVDAKGGIVSYAYDANNDRTSVTNQNGKTTNFAYDAKGNTTAVTDPLGNTTAFTYDAKNNLLTAINPKGNTTTFSYDANGNLLTVKDALGDTTTFAYNSSGHPTSKTDARGNTTAFAYDTSGNLTKITNALGNATNVAYDGISRIISVTDAKSHTATAAYDALSRIVSVADPLGDQTQFAYDAISNLLKITDANGHATAYTYDGTNNMTAVTDAAGNVTRYAYDANNNRTSFTNAKGNTTSYSFDQVNRLSQITDALSLVTSYGYDPVGNVVSAVDANGKTTLFSYDPVNRRVNIAYADDTTVAYSYDADGNRVTMTDPHGTTAYTYDALDRMATVSQPGNPMVHYAHDAAGNRTSLTYPNGKVLSYTYDGLNRLASATDWVGKTTTYSYDAVNNLIQTKYPNQAGATLAYDAANRLTQVVNSALGLPILNIVYTLDKVGNRKSLSVDGIATTFAYDPLNELLSAQLGPAKTTWTYDQVGNRLTQASPTGTTAYTYDADDRVLTAGTETFAHDPNGNRLSQTSHSGTVTYAYDGANRLVSAKGPGSSSSFAYDGDGNRFAQTTNAGTYEYVNDLNTSLPVVLSEQGPDGSVTYAYGLGVVEEYSPAFDYYYHFDGLGSVVALTAANGLPAGAYAYDPWGNALLTVPNTMGTKNKLRFTGEALDPGTGLYYLRARYYDDTVGRFLSKDPAAGTVLNAFTMNEFIYSLNRPIVLSDPSGRSPEEVSGNQTVVVVPSIDNANSTLSIGPPSSITSTNLVSGVIAGTCGVISDINTIFEPTSNFLAGLANYYIYSNGGSQAVSNVPCYSALPIISPIFSSVPTAK